MRNSLAALILAIGMVLAACAISYGIYTFKVMDRMVSVKGLAERTVKADQAIWQIKVNAADNNLSVVYQQINDAQTKIKTFLLNQGFTAAEIQVNPVDITDNQSVSYSANQNVKRYTAQASVTLSTNQIDKVVAAQQQINSLVQQGVVLSNSQVSYFFTHLNDIKPQMLDEATASAKLAAESFANNAHSQLGAIHNASQGLFTITDISQQDYRQNSSIMKNVRVVTTVAYYLK